MWKAWPEVFPSSLRGLFIMASMPWSWATLAPIDAALWEQSPEINRIVPELLIAIGFGINVAIAAALAWFAATRNANGHVV